MKFVVGESEMNKPLTVECARHRLQSLDAPMTVFDEFVVGRQCVRNALLDMKRWCANREVWKCGERDAINRRAGKYVTLYNGSAIHR